MSGGPGSPEPQVAHRRASVQRERDERRHDRPRQRGGLRGSPDGLRQSWQRPRLPVPALQARAARGVQVLPAEGACSPIGGADELRPSRRGTTTGLVAYLDGEPVGWCAVEPRTAYQGLLRVYRVPWEGRQEDKTDESVWSVTCVFVRAGYRKRGIAYELAKAAIEHAKERGARALEAYPMRTEIGNVTWDEIHVGAESIFAAAGLAEVSRPGIRRLVMRIDFESTRGATWLRIPHRSSWFPASGSARGRGTRSPRSCAPTATTSPRSRSPASSRPTPTAPGSRSRTTSTRSSMR